MTTQRPRWKRQNLQVSFQTSARLKRCITIINYNYELEQRLLGLAVLNRGDIWATIAPEFSSDLFEDYTFVQIAKVIEDIAKEGRTPSVTQVYKGCRAKNLDVSTDDLKLLVSGYVSEIEAKLLLTELKEVRTKRRVYSSLIKALDGVQKPEKSADEVLRETQSCLIQAMASISRGEFHNTRRLAEELFERQLQIQEGVATPTFPLSLHGLNTYVGGLEIGSLTIVAARPSMGKTAFALNEALRWANGGLPGLIFSLEQTRIQLAQRMLANVEGLPLGAMRSKLNHVHLEKFNHGLTEFSGLPIQVNDKRGLTVDELCSLARLEKMKNPDLKWIMIDYLTSLKFVGRNLTFEVGDAVRKIRDLAEELEVFVLLLSQLNRGVESRDNKRPMMFDLRDSGNIEEFADTILFLYREGYYHPSFLGNDVGDLITEIIVAKNRQHGNAGKVALGLFRMGLMQWVDLPEDLARPYENYVRHKYSK